MSTQDDIWTTRLRAAVDDHPAALMFDVPTYVVAGRKRVRRNRSAAALATVAAVAVGGAMFAVTGVGSRSAEPPPASPNVPILGSGTNGWVAVDAYEGDTFRGGDIYLGRLGEDARRLDLAESDGANDACPVWSPDGTRLMFGRVTGSEETSSSDPKLVIVPVFRDGATGTTTEIGLDGFKALADFNANPCGVWSPDGRWVAVAGTGEVWVVDTQTGAIRRLPDFRPSDLEWRPGTDELAIAGDLGTNRGAPTSSAPVTMYSVSTGELHQLGSFEAAHITWSPDGTSMAYTGGERDPLRRQLWLVDSDGTNERLLVADIGSAIHGLGPVWSPTGERIAYQRCPEINECRSERHEVVLVSVADGTETVIEPPTADGHVWYPFTVSWSPDGTTLLYAGWNEDGQPLPEGGETLPGGVVAVPADAPSDATVLVDSIDPVPNYYSHRWAAVQMWGRQP